MWKRVKMKLQGLTVTIARHFKNDGYRPEVHYMRGPGPKTLARSQATKGK